MYPGYSDNTLKCLQTVDEEKINMELIELLVAHIADEYEDGAILIFLVRAVKLSNSVKTHSA